MVPQLQNWVHICSKQQMFYTSFIDHNEEVITEVCDLMRTDQILTITEVAKELRISFGSH